MKLWLLTGIYPFGSNYEQYRGFVIRAKTEADARQMAADAGGDEQPRVDDDGEKVWESWNKKGKPIGGWLDPNNTKCKLIGTAEYEFAPPKILLSDFRNA